MDIKDITKRLSELQTTLSTQLSKGFDTALDKVDLQRTPRIGTKLLFTALGLGVGLAVGVGAALLFAPMTGKQTRAKLLGHSEEKTANSKLDDKSDAEKEANRLSSHARRALATATPAMG